MIVLSLVSLCMNSSSISNNYSTSQYDAMHDFLYIGVLSLHWIQIGLSIMADRFIHFKSKFPNLHLLCSLPWYRRDHRYIRRACSCHYFHCVCYTYIGNICIIKFYSYIRWLYTILIDMALYFLWSIYERMKWNTTLMNVCHSCITDCFEENLWYRNVFRFFC